MRKAVIVTGASRGLGREIALAFGRAGWGVAVNYSSSRAKAEAVAKEIISSGGDALVFQADVSIADEAGKLVNAAEARWGRLDALINNAGVSHEALLLRLTDEIARRSSADKPEGAVQYDTGRFTGYDKPNLRPYN